MAESPAALELQVWPAPVLLGRAGPVADINQALADRARRMGELLLERQGLGLAAPQIGCPLRLFVVNLTQEPGGERVFVNPEVVGGDGRARKEEGCLSVPGLFAEVERQARIALRAWDLAGREFLIEAEDLEARVLQHELDHLDGVLFIDRLSTLARLRLRRDLKALERSYKRRLGEEGKRQKVKGKR